MISCAVSSDGVIYSCGCGTFRADRQRAGDDAYSKRRVGDRELAGRARSVRRDLRSALRDRVPLRRAAGRPRSGVRGRVRDARAGVRQAWIVPAGGGRRAAVAARDRLEADPARAAPVRPVSRRRRAGLGGDPHRRSGRGARLGRPQARRARRLGEDAGGAADAGDTDRELLLLVTWDELSYDEAAAVLGLPLGTVRSKLHRAKARLRELLEPNGRTRDDRPIPTPKEATSP